MLWLLHEFEIYFASIYLYILTEEQEGKGEDYAILP
jgi:hypothetical protein